MFSAYFLILMATSDENSFEDQLIDLVKTNEILWHPSYVNHSWLTAKQDIWDKIAKALKQDVSYCKQKWGILRYSYRKCFVKLQSNKNHQKWHRFDQLSFLSDVYTSQIQE